MMEIPGKILSIILMVANFLPADANSFSERTGADTIPSTQALTTAVDSMPGISHSRQLFVGDRLPAQHTRLPKAPLIILDFWNIWCSYCIKAMPEMEKLQAKFGDKIKVILVTRNSAEEVHNLKAHNKILNGIKLPMITGDSILSDWFPTVTFPTHVWLDSNLQVLEITNNYNTTADAVQSYLDGNKVQLITKKELTDFDLDKPLWLEGNGRQQENLEAYSLFMKAIDYRQGTGNSETDSGSDKPRLIRLINYSIFELYETAFDGKLKWGFYDFAPRCRVVSSRKASIVKPGPGPDLDKWAKENTWCYEIAVKPGDENRLYENMRLDVDRFFHLKSRIVRKKQVCLVLAKPPVRRLANNTNMQSMINISPNDSPIVIREKTIQQSLLQYIKSAYPDMMVLDETNDKSKINLTINSSFNNLLMLQKELRNAGFSLLKKVRYIDIVILSDD